MNSDGGSEPSRIFYRPAFSEAHKRTRLLPFWSLLRRIEGLDLP